MKGVPPLVANKKAAWKKRLGNAAAHVFAALGPHHSESVYQRALSEELQASPAWASSISSEVLLPIYYTPSSTCTPLVVGTCRLDLVITCANGDSIAIELKGSASQPKKTMVQVQKYKRLLKETTTIFVIVFGPKHVEINLLQ